MTREEGIWFLPGLCVLLLAGLVFNGVSWKSAARLAPGLAGAAVGCAALLLTLFTLNFMTYGAFIGVDFQDRAFKDAVGALSSIEEGGQIPQVPVSTVAMEKAAAVSPSFARLAADLRPDGPLAHWYLAGCTALPHTCGQIAGGWFVWALRDAAANAGDYASPMRARAVFSQMAADIRAACAAGTLTCRPTLYAHLPHLSGAQWIQVPGRFWEALTTAALVTRGSYDLATTRDEPNESLFNVYWSFLNYPRTYGPTSDRRETLGWVRRAPGEAWPSLAIRDDQGTQVRAHIQRMPSPDLVQMRDDEGAANDRFRADYACPGTCVLDAIFSDGTQLSLPLKVGGAVARSAGDRTLHVDATVAALNPAGLWNRSANAAGHIIRALLRAAPFVFPPLVALALLAFAWAGARCLTDRRLDAAWLSAATAWTLVGTRLALVALVDVSSFPAINAQYTLPATYLMALAIPLSLASGAAAWARRSSLHPKLAGSDGPPSSLSRRPAGRDTASLTHVSARSRLAIRLRGAEGKMLVGEVAGQDRAAETNGVADCFRMPGEADHGEAPFHQPHTHDPDLQEGQDIDEGKAHHLPGGGVRLGSKHETAVEQEGHRHSERIGEHDGHLVVDHQVKGDAAHQIDQRSQSADHQKEEKIAAHARASRFAWGMTDRLSLTAWCGGKPGVAATAQWPG